MPKVSVVIPVYNAEAFLTETLESILGQTFGDFELIVCDNASTDDSFAIAERYSGDPRVQLVRQPSNVGMARNWNECLLRAQGDYIQIVMADDFLLPRHLECFVRVLDERPEVSLVNAPKYYLYPEVARVLAPPFRGQLPGTEAIRMSLEQQWNMIGEPNAVLFRRRDRNIGTFNPYLRWFMDWEFWIRLLKVGDIFVLDEPLSVYRLHDNQLSARIQRSPQRYFEWYFFVEYLILSRSLEFIEDTLLEVQAQRRAEILNMYYDACRRREPSRIEDFERWLRCHGCPKELRQAAHLRRKAWCLNRVRPLPPAQEQALGI